MTFCDFQSSAWGDMAENEGVKWDHSQVQVCQTRESSFLENSGVSNTSKKKQRTSETAVSTPNSHKDSLAQFEFTPRFSESASNSNIWEISVTKLKGKSGLKLSPIRKH